MPSPNGSSAADIVPTMAVPAKPDTTQSFTSSLAEPSLANRELSPLQEAAAKLYGQGMGRKIIAKVLLDHLYPSTRVEYKIRLQRARSKLRKWEKTQKFRDAVYNQAVVELDLQSPNILRGIARKARRGRVDAARLALELTGRHNPKGEQAAPQVIVAINGVPRPDGTRIRMTEPQDYDVDAEAVEAGADDED